MRWLGLDTMKAGVIALMVLLITAPCYAASPNEITIPSGTVIPVRMIDSISSDHNYAGQMFRGHLSAPVVANKRTVLPKGATAYVQLVDVDSAGTLKGRSELKLQLDHVVTPNGTYSVHSDVIAFRGHSQGKKTAKSAGIGAAVGGGLGAIFGGGKGAAIGAGLGAGTGVATRAYKGGRPVYIGSESLINFRLMAPMHVR